MEVSEHQTERTPGNQKKCPQCGVVLSAVVLSGLCPNCLLKQGLKGPPAEGIKTFEPPSLESLAKTMRGIFEPIESIGRGGMGAVFKGRQCSLNRIVALKVMPPQAADGGSIIHRFQREAELLARLSHPNVVGIYEFGLAGNFPYFMMDFVDGSSLRQMLLKSGRLNPSHAVTLFLQLCDGLQHAHDRDVIHRDIKPENLLVDKEGLLKIADLGLAKLNGAGASNEWQTRDSRRMGTEGYMAPEQFEKSQPVDHRADIFSAGVVLYEMLTGKPPTMGRFSAPSQKAKVDPSWDVVLFKALEEDVTLRFQNIREFKRAVEAVQKMYRSDLERQHQCLAKALKETPGDVHVWEQLKQIRDQLNDDGGRILASCRLVGLYRRQNRLAEAILEAQNLMLRLPKGSKGFREARQINLSLFILMMNRRKGRELDEAA